MRRGPLAFLLALSLGAPPTAGQALTELRHVWRAGDPATLALSADGSRLFLSEGAAVGIYDGRDRPPRDATLLARVPVDATIVRLVPAGDRLLVAGGTQGLLAVDLAAHVARRIDDPGELVCTDAAVVGERTVALFAARDASELRVYGGEGGALLHRTPLGAGTAHRVVARGATLWVAMGAGGLARVDLADGDAPPRVRPGPGPAAFPGPEGFALGAPRVRDLAVVGDSLYVAADASGLGALDLTEPWSPATEVALVDAAPAGEPSYACRVVADEERVVVGTHVVPVAMLDGAPATAYGAMGFTGRGGNADLATFAMGSDRHLTVYARTDSGPELSFRTRADGGYGDLVLLGDRLLELRLGSGYHEHSLDPPARGPARWTTVGFPAVDGPLSAVREGALLFGTDAMGSRNAGLLAIGADGIARVPGSESVGSLGFTVGARWEDDEHPGMEWVLGGYGFHWTLHRLDWRGERLAHASWPLAPPLAPGPARDGRRLRGREFFTSHKEGDLLLCGTHGTPWGLVGFAASELVRAARTRAPGEDLAVAPRFQIETHPGGDPGLCFVWRVAVFTDGAGRRVAAVAAGLDADPESPTTTRPLLQLYELRGLEHPRLLGSAVGPNRRGNLTAVEVAVVGERRLAYASDGGAGLCVFDVTDPERPSVVASWAPPPNPFDGEGENALDLVLERDPEGHLWVYLAALRRGVVVLDGSDPAEHLEPAAILDTPGLAYGVTAAVVGGERLLVVGDHQAGLRVYGAPRK